MARISTREQFKQYVLTKLGQPVVDLVIQTSTIDACGGTTGSSGTSGTATTGSSGVSMSQNCSTFPDSAMSQIDLAVDDALDYFHSQASDLGNELAVLYIKLVPHQAYYEVPECIISIQQDLTRGTSFKFDSEEGAEAVGLFSLQSQYGPRGVFSYLGAGSSDNLLNFEIASEFNKLVDVRYTSHYITQYIPLEHKVLIHPTPTESEQSKRIALLVNIKVPDIKCFNNIFVQRYAVCLAMEQIGRNLSMFTGLNINGMDFNAAFYVDNAIQLKEKLEEELRNGTYGNTYVGGIFETG
jgi:hypothetical protein